MNTITVNLELCKFWNKLEQDSMILYRNGTPIFEAIELCLLSRDSDIIIAKVDVVPDSSDTEFGLIVIAKLTFSSNESATMWLLRNQ